MDIQTSALEFFELSRVSRFRVMQHETFSEPTKEMLRSHGIEPDTLFTLAFSYDDEISARVRLAFESAQNDNPYIVFSFYDAGEDEIVSTSLGYIA